MKIFALLLSIVIFAVFTAWAVMQGPETLQLTAVIDEPSPVFLGVIPFLQPEKLKEQIDPVREYLEKKLERSVVMVTASDYESLARLLVLKKIHIAWFSHASFERLGRNADWEALCRPVQYGSVLYEGQIVVRQDSEFFAVKDLRGRVFAYVDRYSGSGFFFPNIYMEQQGIRPLEFFSRVEFTQSHRSSILGLLDGSYDAAAVFSANLVEGSSEELRVIARTGPIPNDPVVVRKDLEQGLKGKIASALLNMHTDNQGAEYLKILTRLRGTEKFVAESEVQAALLQKK